LGQKDINIAYNNINNIYFVWR